MATHFETVQCQATDGFISREFRLYARRSDTLDLTYEDQAFLRHWASKRVHSPLVLAMFEMCKTIEKQFKDVSIDTTLKTNIVELKNLFKDDKLPGMKEYPIHVIRVVVDGEGYSYEVFETNY